MSQGWIKLHRKLTKWEWYHDSKMVHLFIHLILLANHEDGHWQGQDVKRGQLITGRKSLSKETGLSEQEIRTRLVKLKRSRELTIKSTSKFSLITICNYKDYNKREKPVNQQTNQQSTSNQPTDNHKQEVKNVKKEKKKKVLFPIAGKTCGKDGCRMPAVYKTSGGEYDHWLCHNHCPPEVKEEYD